MKKQTGFTLIEIMIALLIGLVILSATISMYVNTVKGSTDTINSARLNYDIESVMLLMVNDLTRAGYWGGATDGVDSSTNPFIAGAANIQIPTAACILYSYDAPSALAVNGDGIVNNGEYYGFKLQSGAISIRSADTAEATANCTGTGWSALTVPQDVNITALTFTTAYKCLNVTTSLSYDTTCAAVVTAANLASGEKAVESRQFNIALTGQLAADTTVTKTLNGTVKVRNDRIFTQ
ncbi:MAG: prepilin-type N-terminal cleavage/methylation domain-containing protein [Methylobacter sp.]|uniref:prepilin-type N-terminal cleavage/methylation domain-containing protein n=1 Tax=Methylobacter sp. TaxID=2051955 RepID=UPI00272F43A4|nr:prepilin-type N-terminal cleavage/methylation domain-containing protein [Methylobacter sp.]MDP1666095.1 prepilin-type N-terminal cleavage/methylation domain-containing protein [Methylobacter sp.]